MQPNALQCNPPPPELECVSEAMAIGWGCHLNACCSCCAVVEGNECEKVKKIILSERGSTVPSGMLFA